MAVVAKDQPSPGFATATRFLEAPTISVPVKPRRLPTYTVWLVSAESLLAPWPGWRSHSLTFIRFETVPLERGSIQAGITAIGTVITCA